MADSKITGAEDEPADDLGRGNLTLEKRVELLERDRAQQSRAITELVQKFQKGFTPEQLAQIRSAFRAEVSGAGLRIDDAEQQDAARRQRGWAMPLVLGAGLVAMLAALYVVFVR